jgi:AmmeMemoRadiSam system protein B
MLIPLLLTLLLQSNTDRPFRTGEGYADTKAQVEAVVKQSRENPAPGFEKSVVPPGPMLAAVCPHDDHALAGPVYLPVMERVKAPRLILLGVAHKAWKWKVENVLIFDDFAAWNGPLGKLSVDTDLRAGLLKAMAPEDVLISNEYHAEEHSLEAFVPWLQQFNCGSKIVPILVPYMSWDRMDALAAKITDALAAIAAKKGWEWGKDFQILISNDSTHYGDQGWDGKNYAPYGVGCDGLLKARENDLRMIDSYLKGPIQGERLKSLLYELVSEKDLKEYKVIWCGRFAIPFGLEFIRRLSERTGIPAPEGKLLAYSTSVELGRLEVKDLPPTAPSNLRHWVAYTAIGFYPASEAPNP